MAILHLVPLFALVMTFPPAPRVNDAAFVVPASMVQQDSSIYVVYYWRARPGKSAEYSEYIRTVAELIDEEARKAGVFEELRTYTPAVVTGAPGADWTHMRVFRLKSFAALDGFSRGLDEAGKRVFPDGVRRAEDATPISELRDLVRQEIWRSF